MYGKHEGLPDGGTAGSLFEDHRGRIWVSVRGGILYFEDGKFVPVPSVSTRNVDNITEEAAGSLWINDQEQGLIHLLGQQVVERISWSALGHKEFAWTIAADPRQRGLWLGFYRGGLAYFKDGQVRASYTGAEGLGEGVVSDLQLDPDGTLWAAAAGGLSRIKDNHVATLNSADGLPCNPVHSLVEDEDHDVWLDMACGLVRISRAELDGWITDRTRKVKTTVFDSSDGVRSQAAPSGYSPHVARSTE